VAERIVLILLLTATLASSLAALFTITKRWYLGVGRAVIIGVATSSAAAAPSAESPQPASETEQLLQNDAAYVAMPSPLPDIEAGAAERC